MGLDEVPVKANGFRTLLFLMFSLLQQLLQSLQKAAKDRTKFRVPVNDILVSLSLHCNGLLVSICIILDLHTVCINLAQKVKKEACILY